MLTWTTSDGLLRADVAAGRLHLEPHHARDSEIPERVLTTYPAPRQWWGTVARAGSALPGFVFRGRIFIGPRLTPDQVCPTCAFIRLAAAFPHPELLDTVFFEAPVLNGEDARLPDRVATAWQEHAADVSAEPGQLLSLPVSGDGPVLRHGVQPPPGPHPWHHLKPRWQSFLCVPDELRDEVAPSRVRPVGDVVDRWVGPILDVRPAQTSQEAPATMSGQVAVAGFLGELTTWQPDVTGSGLYFTPERARLAAAGEVAERYSGNYPNPSKILSTSARTLRSERHARVLTGRDFGGWTADPVFPGGRFRPVDDDAVEDFVRMVSPATNQEVWAPAEAVILNYTRHSRRAPQMPVVLAGIAAGTSLRTACSAAYLELLERDASMVWWHGQEPGSRIVDLPADLPGLPPRGSGICASSYLLPSGTPAVCTVSLLEDRTRGLMVAGFACRIDAAESISKSLAEAWQLHHLSQSLADRDSALWGHIDSGRLPLPVVPHREDRTYAVAFDEGSQPMDQLAYNLQYYLDPEAQERARPRFSECADLPWSQLQKRTRPDLDGWDLLCQSTTAAIADLSTDDFDSHGLRVARVVDTSLVGNYATDFTPWWHPRLASVPDGRRFTRPLPHA